MEFNDGKVREQIVEWIRNWFEENGKGCNAVLGISGGKDSSVVAALCAEALGRDRVVGVLMPNGEQFDIQVSRDLVDHLGIRSVEINIHAAYEGLMGQLKAALGENITPQTVQNLPPRLRMSTVYAVSQSVNGRVANTCNLSEDWVGYSTRYGDSVGDFSPLSQLTVQEVEASATDFSAAVNVLKNAGCDVVIACMNQNPLATLMNTMRDVNYNVNVVTSYVNASATTLGAFVDSGAITDSRMVYCTAWLDVTTEAGMADYTTFYTAMSAWELANGESGSTYALNSYAMAGYIAGSIFVQALQAVDKAGLELNYANFAKIMEETEFSIPMGGTISYAGGDRLGVTALALNCVSLSKNDAGVYALTPVSPILSLADVVAATK